MIKEEAMKIMEAEKDAPVRKVWYVHKETGDYVYRINLFEINDYTELEDD